MNEPESHRETPQVGVAFLLSQVGAHAAYAFEERLAAMELKPHHAGLLRMLGANSGLSQQELSDLFGIFPSRLVLLLDHLAARGLIERRDHQSDRRSYRIHLTKAGRNALRRIERLTRELEHDLCGSLSKAEHRSLVSLLERIVAHREVTPAVHPAYRKLQDDKDQPARRPIGKRKRAR